MYLCALYIMYYVSHTFMYCLFFKFQAEVDAREGSITGVIKTGKKLIQQLHYASAEVSGPK